MQKTLEMFWVYKQVRFRFIVFGADNYSNTFFECIISILIKNPRFVFEV